MTIRIPRLFQLLLLAGLSSPTLPALHAAPPKKSVRLLAIGNSFARDSTYFLPRIAKSMGKEVVLTVAHIGGGSMEKHVERLDAYLADPDSKAGRPYKVTGPKKSGPVQRGLPELLKAEAWDIVTIQQVSTLSFKPETYHPYAERLIETIRQYAPTAEIAIVQTWSYRHDHPMLASTKLTPQTMFDEARAAYDALAAMHGLRIIPVGAAFQKARELPEWQLGEEDPTYDFVNPVLGTFPRDRGGLHTGWVWITDRKTQAQKLVLDAKHANQAGRYPGSSVFYDFLFGGPLAAKSFILETEMMVEC